MSKKVVFFFPSFASTDATAPLGLLAVATPLLRAGYSIRLIDSTITPNYQKRVLEEVKDALCLGISLVTGPMIRETAEIARAVKEWNPDFPVILGGWHPSLLPKQTLGGGVYRLVVKGQGEDALLDVVEHIWAGIVLRRIWCRGSASSEDGRLIFTTERRARSRLSSCRPRPIISPISTLTSGSAGGAGRCTFRAWRVRTTARTAPTQGVYGRKWNALPAEQLVEEDRRSGTTVWSGIVVGGRRQLSGRSGARG